MDKFKGKEKIGEMWKKGLSTWEEHRNVRGCSEEKAKACLELNLGKEAKDNKRVFF